MARIHVDLQLRWGDQDAYQHVNNVAYARYFEEARVRVFFVGDTREETGLDGLFRDDTPEGMKMIVASQTIEFMKPLEYTKDPVTVELWIGRLGGSSLDLNAELVTNTPEPTVVARCVTTAVVVDGITMKPKRLSAEAREVATRWMEDPIQFTRSRNA